MFRYFVSMIFPKFSKVTHEKYSKCECNVTLITFTNVDISFHKTQNFWPLFGVLPVMLGTCKWACWIASPILDIPKKNWPGVPLPEYCPVQTG